MFTKKDFRAFRSKARKNFPWLSDISYSSRSDIMEAVVLRSQSDQDAITESASFHLFLDQGYYHCSLETGKGPHFFAGVLAKDGDPALLGKLKKEYQFYAEKNAEHFNALLDLCDEFGSYPCHIDFYYPLRRVSIITGEDARISQVISRLKVSPLENPDRIARRANLINRSISRRTGSRHTFAFHLHESYFDLSEEGLDINRETYFSEAFQHLTDAGVCAGYFAVVDDGVEVEVEARKWDYEAEQRKYENHEPPYSFPEQE